MINIKKFRRIQTIASIAIFVLVFLTCWKTTNFNLKDIQLSYWGIDNKLAWFWNTCVVILSISIYQNVHQYIEQHPRLQYKRVPKIMFFIVSLCLFLTGIVNMHHPLHNFTAYIYFFAYPLCIFVLAHLNRKFLQYKEWFTHVMLSIAMVILPLIFIAIFPGMAITETVHSLVVIGWNLWILIDD